MGKDWQQLTTNLPKQPTLVQKPFEYPCDGALYFTKKHHYHILDLFSKNGFLEGSNARTNQPTGCHGVWDAKTGELFVKDEINSDDFDLIMFVWE